MSQFCVKFSYNQTIKKVIITKSQLTWKNVCTILMKSFYLSEKDRIQLKYKDLENDEITVNSDEDLHEAYNLYFMKSIIKFFVYYSGVFSQSNLTKQTTGYSKIQRPLSFSGTLPGTIEITEVRKRSDNILDESKHKLLDEDETKALPNGNMLKINIDSTKLQDIFREVFSETEVLQKIQGKLKNYISKENKGSEQAVEYSIQTDYQAVANYMMSTLSDVMNKKFSEEDSSKIPIKQVSETLVESNQKKLATQQEEQRKDLSQDYKSLMNDSLKESLYGGSVQVFPRISKGRDSLAQSLNSSMDNKTLSNMGVRLVLKYEAGKPRLISVPTVDYSIIEAHSSNEVENLATSMNIDKNLCIKFR